jgi:hypothetical protein
MELATRPGTDECGRGNDRQVPDDQGMAVSSPRHGQEVRRHEDRARGRPGGDRRPHRCVDHLAAAWAPAMASGRPGRRRPAGLVVCCYPAPAPAPIAAGADPADVQRARGTSLNGGCQASLWWRVSSVGQACSCPGFSFGQGSPEATRSGFGHGLVGVLGQALGFPGEETRCGLGGRVGVRGSHREPLQRRHRPVPVRHHTASLGARSHRRFSLTAAGTVGPRSGLVPGGGCSSTTSAAPLGVNTTRIRSRIGWTERQPLNRRHPSVRRSCMVYPSLNQPVLAETAPA